MAGLALSAAAVAEETMPPLGDPGRVRYAVKCAGPMPSLLIKAIIAIIVLTVISVVYYIKVVNRNEK